ncbi:MAG: putative dehydrogenase [Planctomycetaceae bacterium]|nr:putative dehydrogenase [Planctomycetaceae bacterium]
MIEKPTNDRSSRRAFLESAGVAAVTSSLLPGWLAATQAGTKEKPAKVRPPKIKIGQIGVGHAHASKLAIYRQSEDYEVVGVVESDPELRQKATTQELYRGLTWMTPDQLLNVSGLQAVLVETQVRDLLNTAEKCVAAGKHVHIDKPAGESLSQFRRILDTAGQQRLLVQMGYMFRYNPAVVLLREFLKQGWLGDIFEIHTVMSKVVDPASRRRLAEYRGGIMFELGCHVIDLVIGILGKPTAVTPYFQHAASNEDTLSDNMLAVLTYARAIASVKSSALEFDGGNRRHLVVCGSEGTFHIQPLDNPSATVTLSKRRGDYQQGPQTVSFPKYERYVADAADMAQIIRGEKSSDFPYAHDLTVQTTLLQACGFPPG